MFDLHLLHLNLLKHSLEKSIYSVFQTIIVSFLSHYQIMYNIVGTVPDVYQYSHEKIHCYVTVINDPKVILFCFNENKLLLSDLN